jgi:hypothetical protein
MDSATSAAPIARPDKCGAGDGGGLTTNLAAAAATTAPAACASQYGPRSLAPSLPRRKAARLTAGL